MAIKPKLPSVLAFDTSSRSLSVALLAGGRRYHSRLKSKLPDSEKLFEVIDRLTKKAGWPISAVDLVAVGLGPGSFTGLRIGIAAAKTLAFAGHKKLVGISSLEAVGLSELKAGRTVTVVLDAGRGNVYTASFKADGRHIAPGLRSYRRFKASLSMRMHYLVHRKASFMEDLKKACQTKHISLKIHNAYPDAKHILNLAIKRWQMGRFDDVFKLEPDYLYPRDCNVTQPRPKRK